MIAESTGSHFVFVGVVIAIVAAVFVFGHLANLRRQKELTALAERLGLFFAPHPDDAHERYFSFTPMGNGSGKRSSNLVHGKRGDVDWEIFDYKYSTGSGKNRRTHHFGIAAAKVPLRFRKMVIRPEGWFDKVAQMVTGGGDINFESEEFSRRYHVSCDVRKFAYDLIHPRMIEFLMSCPTMHWQLAGDVILLHKRGKFSIVEIERVIAMVEGFLERMPEYVKQDIGPVGVRIPPSL